MELSTLCPDFLFEISWEVCNRVGGIYTVVSSKAKYIMDRFGDRYITIGPDIWRGAGSNPDFLEDDNLFKSWKKEAIAKGLKIKVGRWNIAAQPIAILIDYDSLFNVKNEIFGELYSDYGLDSLTGGWDYIEPALFGYYAGMVVESFYDYHLSEEDKVLAQFHEWMSGAGILYLKKQEPAIATMFITHATVTGRAISGSGQPLYEELTNYNGEEKAIYFNVRSKHSLEKISAREADCFSTVSEITNRECGQLLQKQADIITPNGFDESCCKSEEEYAEKRSAARKKLLSVASAIFGKTFSDHTLLTAIGGRYEFRNKGIDIFIKALADINKNASDITKPVVAFILIPGGHTGAREELLQRLSRPDAIYPSMPAITHYLQNEQEDIIVKTMNNVNLNRNIRDHVHVVFAPVYLDGKDGIFNMRYYELLLGFDITVFPSLYEPWGYTPQESLSFGIPTVTSSFSGFGNWITSHVPDHHDCINIIRRTYANDQQATGEISHILLEYLSKDMTLVRKKAGAIAEKTFWKHFIVYYEEAWNIALKKIKDREEAIREKMKSKKASAKIVMDFPEPEEPKWNKIYVCPELPPAFQPLEHLSRNLWWTWNHEAAELFSEIDPEKWEASGHNPITVLNEQPLSRFETLNHDKEFMHKLEAVSREFEHYMADNTYRDNFQVAYFCMEYGLHATMKLYAGGLGILAGDYLKEASDEKHNIAGIGLLYQYGYFRQSFSFNKEQLATKDENKFTQLPLLPVRDEQNNWRTVEIPMPGRKLLAKVWEVKVGRVSLFLLDTDMPENNPSDRLITNQLYSGDMEHRLLQELLLGIGGIQLLDTLNYHPAVYHLNEGHAAFAGLERLRKFVQEDHLSFHEALELVRSSTLFTTHTPVPAGNDQFSETLLRVYLSHYPELLNISWELLMSLGRENPKDSHELFSMSYFAIRLAQEVNGVSRIHGKVARKMFARLWPGWGENELFISHITNGVHYPTWAAPEWQETYHQNAHIAPEKIFSIKKKLKSQFIEYLKTELLKDLPSGLQHPHLFTEVLNDLTEDTMLIGFARRFTAYKRGMLLFHDPDNLAAIVNNKERPVIFLFAGKAHPNDREGQEILKQLLLFIEKPALAGKIIFLENYNMDIAQKMISGVDVWLNTPERLSEACGTSGMKAAMNGTLNLSVADGWWAEAFKEKTGWKLSEEQIYPDNTWQNELDTHLLYNLLEEEIIPLYYHKNEAGIPAKWISYIQNSLEAFIPGYTTSRMMEEYYNKFYQKLSARNTLLKNENYKLARQLSAWKKKMTENWDLIEIKNVHTADYAHQELKQGNAFEASITLYTGRLTAADLRMEAVFARKNEKEEIEIKFSRQLDAINEPGGMCYFSCSFTLDMPGVYHYGFRLYPKNELLPHHQDMTLVKWI